MGVFNSAVLTARGNELLVDAVAGDKIVFTRMAVGSGVYSDEERERRALEKAVGLKDVRQEFSFSAHRKVSEQCVLLTAVISNRELERSYKITEIGIYGKRLGDEEDFLCSVAVTKSLEESDTFPPFNGLQECQIVQDYYITISPDAEVSVNTEGACVLREEFENLKSVILGMLDGKVDKSAVADNLTTTVSGFWLDARQGKVLKDMIDGVNVVINNLMQSFQAGCKKIVDKLTALGYAPAAPQGPDEINVQIQTIYDDRYNLGREQGRNDVIADPGAYGIDQIKNIYQQIMSAQKFEDISHAETVFDYWDSFSHNDEVEYQIALKSDKFLYAVTFDIEYYAIQGYDSPCMVAYEYSVSTVEGAVIQADRINDTTTGSTTNFGTVTKNVLVDFLQKSFETDYEYLVLKIGYSMSGQVTSTQEQVCQAKISFTDIQARYK